LIEGDRYTWSEDNAKKVREEPAKYELYDEKGNLIYIGSAKNLRERFTGYISSDFDKDPCKQRTKSYKREYVSSGEKARELEEQNLDEYKKKHGKLPACNERVG
jgi:excinuclease UvrABC nuclease subunit